MSHPNDAEIFEGDIPDHNAVLDNSYNNNDWKKVLNLYLTITMSTTMTLNKTITLPILFLDNQTKYVSLTQDTTITIL